jgi:hypothetical protein
LRNELKEKILEIENLKKEVVKTKIDYQKQLDLEKKLRENIADLKNLNLQLKSKVSKLISDSTRRRYEEGGCSVWRYKKIRKEI